MKYIIYLLLPMVIFMQTLLAQTGSLSLADNRDNLFALNTDKTKDVTKPVALYSVPSATGRGGGGAGEGVPFFSLYESLDLGIVSAKTKYGGLSGNGSGLRYQAEIGAKIPLVLMEYNQFIVTGSVFIQRMETKNILTDTSGGKNDIKISSAGIPLTLTVIHVNKSGGVLGYYYELGVNISYVVEAKDDSKNFIKQFNRVLVQPNASLGLSFAKNGG